MTRGGRRGGDAGFTLLEVLVALAILSVAVVAVIQGFAQGLRLLRLAGEQQAAVLLADQKLREVITPVADQHDQGADGPFTWERSTTALETPDLARARATAPWSVYRVTVKVRWGETTPRQVEIAALRSVPDQPTWTEAPR